MKNNLWTPQSSINLGEDFRKEILSMLKKVAGENKCNVEELKFRVDNTGTVNIRKMSPAEMAEREADRIIKKRMKAVRKARRELIRSRN